MIILTRMLANLLMASMILFLVHRYFIFWHNWPDISQSLSALTGVASDISNPVSYVVVASYSLVYLLVIWRALSRQYDSLMVESIRYGEWSAFIIRFAFWSVFLVGMVDASISALRVENLLGPVIGEALDVKFGLANFRGTYVHYPLLAFSIIIATFTRNLSFIWLAFLVVIAEFAIVITRFVFSYEQAYMGDLVRFWYAALFLFASAYTLVEEGHVRVDVIFASMSERGKAWVNTIGCLVLGIPFCFTILLTGFESKRSSLASPIVNFEISQSGFGMYVKYLMAGFLLVFAISMVIQFLSYFLKNAAFLLGDKKVSQINEAPH